MSGEQPASFRTKTGTCTITPEEIILTRQGWRGMLSSVLFPTFLPPSLTYSLFSLITVLVGWSYFRVSDWPPAIILWLLAAAFFAHALLGLRNSAAPVVRRKAIMRVETHPPREGLTRAYFVVWFKKGKAIRKRGILLPGSWYDGTREYEKALGILRSAKLIA